MFRLRDFTHENRRCTSITRERVRRTKIAWNSSQTTHSTRLSKRSTAPRSPFAPKMQSICNQLHSICTPCEPHRGLSWSTTLKPESSNLAPESRKDRPQILGKSVSVDGVANKPTWVELWHIVNLVFSSNLDFFLRILEGSLFPLPGGYIVAQGNSGIRASLRTRGFDSRPRLKVSLGFVG